MKTLNQAAAFFGQLAAGGYKHNLSPILDLMGSHVKTEVEKEIGEYQSGIGPFPDTAQLSDVTLERKGREGLGKGGDPDTPLWATGEFHDSIQVHKDVPSLSVEIGSDVDHVVFQEMGAGNAPPRPVFGPSVLRAIPPIMPQIEATAAMGLAGGVWSGLGVEGITHAGGHDTANIQLE